MPICRRVTQMGSYAKPLGKNSLNGLRIEKHNKVQFELQFVCSFCNATNSIIYLGTGALSFFLANQKSTRTKNAVSVVCNSCGATNEVK